MLRQKSICMPGQVHVGEGSGKEPSTALPVANLKVIPIDEQFLQAMSPEPVDSIQA